MKTDTQIRNQLLRRIQRIPTEKIKELNDYVGKIEKTLNKKDKILAFAGAWDDLDKDTFIEFTDKLNEKRARNKRRTNE